jgi:YidC/Oxa1 family membrane protein insertase
MEKRVLLAVSLSFLVLFLYQRFLVPPPPEGAQPETAPMDASGAGGEAANQPSLPSPANAVSGSGASEPAAVEAASPVVADSTEREVVVESELVRAAFSTRGAELKSYRLKRFNDPQGRPIDLVASAVAPGTPKPFSVVAEDPAVTTTLAAALFRPSAEQLVVSTEPATLVFEYEDASGLRARKEFTFDPARKPYVITVNASVEANGGPISHGLALGPALDDTHAEGQSSYNQLQQAIFSRDGSETRIAASDLAEQPVQEGLFDFIGVDDHYFLSASIPRGTPLRVRYTPLHLPPLAGSEKPRQFVEYAVELPKGPAPTDFFIGPKEFDTLKKVDAELVRSIHFGMFSFLVVPLLGGLRRLYGYVGNYGWAIIIMTVIINAAMFPLRHKSVVAMRKMQELQPEVKAIQDRYAKLKMNDPARQKMNVELMNLYRERGVNPASGCMPMLLTMPVLFAFYSLLSVAIEIRGAPFVGWIRDLSMHDPLYITPILMGGSMVIQQKMTPSTADPMQQKIMMFMPVMFTFMFLWAPSGLVIYWLTSNLWAIGQQQVTNRLIGPTVLKTVRPPAERKVKRVGSGKTEQAEGH